MGRPSANSLTAGRAIALLRAVNVGGRSLKMEDLRQILHGLGYVEPRTLLQSGNAVFGFEPNSPVRTAAAVEAQIEEELQKRLSLQSDVFVRSAAEWNEAIAGNPFPKQAASDPAHLVLGTLRDAPSASAVAALRAAIKGPELVQARGRYLYVVYPDGIGPSKLTGGVIDRALATRGTARNWNTVLKLAALAGE
jgi:uncharacterized protein (DUF1697 family)